MFSDDYADEHADDSDNEDSPPSAAVTAALVHIKSLCTNINDLKYASKELLTHYRIQHRNKELYDNLPTSLHDKIKVVDYELEKYFSGETHTITYLVCPSDGGEEVKLRIIVDMTPGNDPRSDCETYRRVIKVSLGEETISRAHFEWFFGTTGRLDLTTFRTKQLHGDIRQVLRKRVAEGLLGMKIPSKPSLSEEEKEKLSDIILFSGYMKGRKMQVEQEEMDNYNILVAFLGEEVLDMGRRGHYKEPLRDALIRDSEGSFRVPA